MKTTEKPLEKPFTTYHVLARVDIYDKVYAKNAIKDLDQFIKIFNDGYNPQIEVKIINVTGERKYEKRT